MITVFNWSFLALIIIACGFALDPKKFGDPDWGRVARAISISYPCIFFILFVLLTVSVRVLISKLKAKNETLGASDDNKSDNFFKKEIKTLSIILIIFSFSYLIRVVFDFFWLVPENADYFTKLMVSMLAVVPFDLLPLLVVLFFHRRNLSRIDTSVENMKIGQHDSILLSNGGGGL